MKRSFLLLHLWALSHLWAMIVITFVGAVVTFVGAMLSHLWLLLHFGRCVVTFVVVITFVGVFTFVGLTRTPLLGNPYSGDTPIKGELFRATRGNISFNTTANPY